MLSLLLEPLGRPGPSTAPAAAHSALDIDDEPRALDAVLRPLLLDLERVAQDLRAAEHAWATVGSMAPAATGRAG